MAQMMVNFYSHTLGHGVDIAVTIPSLSSCDGKDGQPVSHKVEHKYPVLYMLHGHGNDYRCWLRYTSVERLAEEQRMAIVTFNSENKAYNNCAGDDRYEDFLAYELPEFITSMFPVSDRPEDTYIAGLSMGGYGTLAHAFKYPHRYCAYGAMSPAPSIRKRPHFAGLDFDPIEPIEEAAARIREGVKLPKGYICCGRQDFLYESVCKFVEELKALGEDFEWRDVDGFEHEWRFWDLELPRFFAWLPRTDYYADKPHKI